MPKGKAPALMLYTGDWLKDTELSACSPATRGIWADWLCRMREQVAAGRRPRLSCRVEAFARLGRCSAEEALNALVELHETDAASVTMSRDVTPRHAEVTDVITLENRRMSREWRSSQGAALRQREKRKRDAESQDSNADVTAPLHLHLQIQEEGETKTSPPSASGDAGERAPSKADRDFARWWPAYPNPKGKANSLAAWRQMKAADRDADAVLRFLAVAVESAAWTKEGGRYIPNGDKFTRGKTWQDAVEAYPPPRGNLNAHAAGTSDYQEPGQVEGYLLRKGHLEGLRSLPEQMRETDETDADLDRFEASLRLELDAINANPELKRELRTQLDATS